MADCKDLHVIGSQAYKDCVEKTKIKDVVKADEIEEPIIAVEKVKGTTVEGNVKKNSAYRDAFAIKLGTKLVDEVTTRTTKNSWDQVVNNMFDLPAGVDITIDEKYDKLKNKPIGYLRDSDNKEEIELYKEYRNILEATPGYEPRVDSVYASNNEDFKKIKETARIEFDKVVDLRKEQELREAVGDKVYDIYKAAGFDSSKITEASLLNTDPEKGITFDEEEIKANEILINKGLNKFKQRRADSVIDNFRKDNNISGLGFGKNKELNYQEIIRGVEAWFYEGDESSSVFYPNQKILVENIEKAKQKAIENKTYPADEIRKMRNATPEQL